MTNPLPDNAGLVERLRDEDLLMHATPHQLHDLLHEAAIALEASEEELKLLRPVYEAARGLCHGTDWNNGNHARLHGYREKLIAATAIARATLRNRENEK